MVALKGLFLSNS